MPVAFLACRHAGIRLFRHELHGCKPFATQPAHGAAGDVIPNIWRAVSATYLRTWQSAAKASRTASAQPGRMVIRQRAPSGPQGVDYPARKSALASA